VTQEVRDPDGRRLSVESRGDPDGKAVFLLHGTPGGRNGPRPRGIVLYRLGIRLISYDRPGYPGSDRDPERTVASAAENVKAIADYFGIDRFSVVGRSGGAPHALACAALLPDRVISAAALSSLAPCDAEDLKWTDGMTDSNVRAYGYANTKQYNALRAMLKEQAERVSKGSEGLLSALWSEMDDHDKEVVDDIALRRIIADIHVEALSNNCVDGWVDDVIALSRPWGFEPAKITVPVKLWGAQHDVFSPVGHTYWLAERINGAEVKIEEGKSHFGSVEILPRILAWAAKNANLERPSELAVDHGTYRALQLSPAESGGGQQRHALVRQWIDRAEQATFADSATAQGGGNVRMLGPDQLA
jgi:pimeloyl-ACP methyl ester carboxylesterase